MPGSSANPGFWTTLRRHLNFFRIHLLFLCAPHIECTSNDPCLTVVSSSTFTPLICSVILYASNGRYPIAYIDALYNSVSAITVCGLGTVDLSQLTPWQQTLLFIQMCVGSPVSNSHVDHTRPAGNRESLDLIQVLVSWFMVYIRRRVSALYPQPT